jgi:uncharacterized membrane protein
VTRARLALVALPGAVVFLVCCLVMRGGLLDHHPYGDAHIYGHYAHEMTSGQWPYRDFFDEYPPLAQPLFFVVRLLPGPFATSFKWTMALCGAAALVLLVLAIRASFVRVAVAAGVVAISPLLVGPVFLNTYDLFPALLTIATVLAFMRRRERTTCVLLALAVAAKVFPLVLLPLVLIESWERGGRDAVRRALSWFGGVLVLVHLPFAILGPGGLRFSYWVQLKRGLEVESLGGSALLVLDRLGVYHATLRDEPPGSKNVVGGLADAVGVATSLVLLVAVALAIWLFARRRRDPVLAAAAAVVGFVAFNKVFSPQYVTWLVPLVPAAGLAASALLAAVLGLTHVVFNRFHTPASGSEHYKAVLTWWVAARDALVVALYALLVFKLRRSPRTRKM